MLIFPHQFAVEKSTYINIYYGTLRDLFCATLTTEAWFPIREENFQTHHSSLNSLVPWIRWLPQPTQTMSDEKVWMFLFVFVQIFMGWIYGWICPRGLVEIALSLSSFDAPPTGSSPSLLWTGNRLRNRLNFSSVSPLAELRMPPSGLQRLELKTF